ncbi:unnamed protein product [Ambrosiozyma monospora]|uniref:Unnamed protein product n=1 Tax=Ambrosiozyma monospora TaxID=43982 RepID=A0A9W7DGM3_AMBMO|nr:unnamed protein product [Ambrosiozyma monospora]
MITSFKKVYLASFLQLFTAIATCQFIILPQFSYPPPNVTVVSVSMHTFAMLINLTSPYIQTVICHGFLTFISFGSFITASLQLIHAVREIMNGHSDWQYWLCLVTTFASFTAFSLSLFDLRRIYQISRHTGFKEQQQAQSNPRILSMMDGENGSTVGFNLKKKSAVSLVAPFILLLTISIADPSEVFGGISCCACLLTGLSIVSTILSMFSISKANDLYAWFVVFAALCLSTTYAGIIIRETTLGHSGELYWENKFFKTIKWGLIPISVIEFYSFILLFFNLDHTFKSSGPNSSFSSKNNN